MKTFRFFRIFTMCGIVCLLMLGTSPTQSRIYADDTSTTCESASEENLSNAVSASASEPSETKAAESSEVSESLEVSESKTAESSEVPESETAEPSEVPESGTTATTEMQESETSTATEIQETETTAATEIQETETTAATEEPVKISLSSCKVSLSYTSCTYNGAARKPTPTVTLTTNGKTVTLKKNTDYTVSYSNNTKVGTAKVTIKGKGNYSGSVSRTFTIKAKSLSKATVKLSTTSYTYNGTARKPTPTVTLTLNSKTVTLKKNTDYTVSYSSNTKAGTAKVTIKGKGNYSGSVSKTFTIKAKSISKATVKLSTTSYTYNGTARKPSATVKLTVNGKTVTLKKNTDYTVSYSNNTKAGTAKVTIKGKGNYSGSVSKTFTIKKKSLSKATVKLSKTSYTYNGEAKKPSVTVKLTVNGKTVTLKKNTDYTVTYSSNTKVGTAKVTIKGKGNYSGSVSKTYTIKPKATSISKYTVSENTISLTLKKISTQATGYQVQYATDSAFTKNKTTKTISSYKTLTKKLTGLKYKTTYYVRVRTYKTVDGKKYYSAWSSASKIKTKSAGGFKVENGVTYYKYDDGTKAKSTFVTVDGKKYYFDADGVMETGWTKISGSYYYFHIADGKNGYMATSTTINGISLGSDGKATATDSYSLGKLSVMLKAKAIAEKATTPSMTKEEKLKAVWDYSIANFLYKGSPTFVLSDDWDLVYALQMFDDGHGSCYAYGASFAYLANAVGYTDCKAVSSGGHGWAEVDGYVYDPAWAQIDTKHNYYGMSFDLSGVDGRPGYKKARMYVVDI